jgi:regulator of protease activity HflC (stomatin/prohibitin superfamily)
VVLDEATGKWGIRINRVEIKSVDPPPDIRSAMEKQMRAERDRRAAILTAEGEKQSQILTAEGAKQAAVLTAEGAQQAAVLDAEGERQAAILRAEGEAKAIDTVFSAIHEGKPNRELLSYEYLQMLPQLAEGDANKVFVVPSEFAQAFGGIGEALARATGGGPNAPIDQGAGGPAGAEGPGELPGSSAQQPGGPPPHRPRPRGDG